MPHLRCGNFFAAHDASRVALSGVITTSKIFAMFYVLPSCSCARRTRAFWAAGASGTADEHRGDKSIRRLFKRQIFYVRNASNGLVYTVCWNRSNPSTDLQMVSFGFKCFIFQSFRTDCTYTALLDSTVQFEPSVIDFFSIFFCPVTPITFDVHPGLFYPVRRSTWNVFPDCSVQWNGLISTFFPDCPVWWDGVQITYIPDFLVWWDWVQSTFIADCPVWLNWVQSTFIIDYSVRWDVFMSTFIPDCFVRWNWIDGFYPKCQFCRRICFK